jgi:hypothetical protein
MAIAVKSGSTTSAVAKAAYTINLATVASPTFSANPLTFLDDITVMLTTTTAGATIHYTVDGTTPTTASSVYSAAIPITATTTVKAIAVKSGMLPSAVSSSVFTRQCRQPVFSPVAGSYKGIQYVEMTTPTTGAAIYYTIDGTVPTARSKKYTGAVTVSYDQTLRAIAVKTGLQNSSVTAGAYSLTLYSSTGATAGVSFSVPSGDYTLAQSVSLTSTTPGAVIYYTTDWSEPSTSSIKYTGTPLKVSTTTTIKARAYSSTGTNPSLVTARNYRF